MEEHNMLRNASAQQSSSQTFSMVFLAPVAPSSVPLLAQAFVANNFWRRRPRTHQCFICSAIPAASSSQQITTSSDLPPVKLNKNIDENTHRHHPQQQQNGLLTSRSTTTTTTLRRTRSPVNWTQILHAAVVAGVATAIAQVVGTPIDMAHRIAKASNGALSVHRALYHGTIHRTIFNSLPLHLLKRTPTKCLTVLLFEYTTQKLQPARHQSTPTTKARSLQHLSIAFSCGALAMFATYPLHITYYALRKGLPVSSLVSVLRAPSRLYSSIAPAILAILPSVTVDYSVYKSIRAKAAHAQIATGSGTTAANSTGSRPRRCESAMVASAISTASGHHYLQSTCVATDRVTRSKPNMLAVVFAAAIASSVGGLVAEPLKSVHRRMAVESVQQLGRLGRPSLIGTVSEMLQHSGPGEFWRGFRIRALRYGLSAVTAKLTAESLRSSALAYSQDMDRSCSGERQSARMVLAQ